MESRDPYTAGYQSRSADLARAIATEIGLDQDKIDGIYMAGIVHDIGKIAIPAEILIKPTKLTNIEFSLIKQHSVSGYEILKDVESPWSLAEIVYQHHERMDGSGYPRNLKGDEIIMEARILSVADVVEAMASHRPYRAALGIEAALEEIKKNKGTLYDDAVADACLMLSSLSASTRMVASSERVFSIPMVCVFRFSHVLSLSAILDPTKISDTFLNFRLTRDVLFNIMNRTSLFIM
ncbi:MAG: HD-GYP domain-containing protein [Smithella sp.]|nr:HD-GYP domain-containing protein [Smithella sp.]